jgi:hypothetical protein
MWARRQAHETAIHRVDGQLAAGLPLSPWAPVFAADGIDELLSLFVPRRSTALRADPPVTLAVRCADVDASWLLRLDEHGVTTTPATGSDLDGAPCTVTGRAGDLYLALWNRAGSEHLSVAGERSMLGRFSEVVQIRWS